MRLRKTLKRTAAATLALSMALSAAAPAVTAAYICDVSQGSVNIAVDEDGNKSIQVNGEDVTDDGDGTDDIIITGDNTQAAASQNETEETASAAEGSENTPSEDGTDQTGSAKETGNDKGSDEPAAPEQPAPTTAPAGDRAAEPPAKPETTVPETKDGTVINYGVTEADPDVQAEKPVVKAIHAGLECGLFSEKLPGLDAVSFGPRMRDIHTTRERLCISSTERTYAYLCRVLERL